MQQDAAPSQVYFKNSGRNRASEKKEDDADNIEQAIIKAQEKIAKKKAGNLVGIFACISGVLAIMSVGIVFVPLTILLAVIGFFQALSARNGNGEAISVVAFMLAIVGLLMSPTIWLLLIGLIATSTEAYDNYAEKAKQLGNETVVEPVDTNVIPNDFSITNGDFRGFSWGDSIEYVKQNEVLSLYEKSEDSLIYKSTLSGISMVVGYIFVDGKLFRTAYISNEKYFNQNKFVNDYKEIDQLLDKKYGSPTYRKITWLQDLYEGDLDHLGTAVSIGHLVYRSEWVDGNTQIVSSLTGDNFEIKHAVIYSDRLSIDANSKKNENEAIELL